MLKELKFKDFLKLKNENQIF